MEENRFKKELGDVWTVKGKTWYSSRIIDEIIKVCKSTKEAYKDGYVRNLLADDILNLLDYKDNREDK